MSDSDEEGFVLKRPSQPHIPEWYKNMNGKI